MSLQFLGQIQSLEDNYNSAYESLKGYCTGWRTLLNPKRWAIQRALKGIKAKSSASKVINHLFTAVPSLATIDPISKLGAILSVIAKNETELKGLNTAAKAGMKNIVDLHNGLTEPNLVKLLRRYSAWGIVRLFTGELGNEHVKEVRGLIKRWNAATLTYDNLIQELKDLDVKKGDALEDLKTLIKVEEEGDEDRETEDDHSTSKSSVKSSEEMYSKVSQELRERSGSSVKKKKDRREQTEESEPDDNEEERIQRGAEKLIIIDPTNELEHQKLLTLVGVVDSIMDLLDLCKRDNECHKQDLRDIHAELKSDFTKFQENKAMTEEEHREKAKLKDRFVAFFMQEFVLFQMRSTPTRQLPELYEHLKVVITVASKVMEDIKRNTLNYKLTPWFEACMNEQEAQTQLNHYAKEQGILYKKDMDLLNGDVIQVDEASVARM